LSTPDTPLEAELRKRGIVHPQFTVQEAEQVSLSLAAACAMLEMETSGGNNEFGHDSGNPIQGGTVTEDRYDLMRHYVSVGHPPQGTGPCQLTSLSLLDQADKLGGSWIVETNMRVGFLFLRQLRSEFGSQAGFQHYNGSGSAAIAYGRMAMQRESYWQTVINSVLK
jgi:hypothetical protein